MKLSEASELYHKSNINGCISESFGVVISCLEAIHTDGLDRPYFMNESFNSMKDVLLSMLENVKNTLITIYEKVIKNLDVYILNDISSIKKYRDNLDKIDTDALHVIRYESYSYDRLFELPKKISINKSYFTKENMLQDINNDSKAGLSDKIDKMIDKEVREMMDGVIYPPYSMSDFNKAFPETTTDVMRGHVISEVMNAEKLKDFMDEVMDYKKFKEDVVKTKKEIIENYAHLKDAISNTFTIEADKARENFQIKYHGEMLSEVDMKTANKLNWYVVECNRFFNAMIFLYNKAFSIKLDLCQDRVQSYKYIIRESLKACNVRQFSDAVNKKKIYVYTPKTLKLEDYKDYDKR